jgi:hypothetical protein
MFCRNREKVSEFPTFCASMTMATKSTQPTDSNAQDGVYVFPTDKLQSPCSTDVSIHTGTERTIHNCFALTVPLCFHDNGNKIYPTHSDVYCMQGQHDIGYHILN